MKQIVVVKPKTLSAKDKGKLTKGGYLVIEHEMPSEVRIIQKTEGINGDVILLSAMKALVSTYPKDKFSEEVSRRLLDAESKGALAGG